MGRVVTAVSLVALVGAWCPNSGASAQHESAASSVGHGSWALPGMARVPVAHLSVPRLVLAADVGYAWTETQADEPGSHHRVLGSLAAGIVATPWLAAALRLEGRYDRHPPDELGDDHGWMGTPGIALRLGAPTDSAFAVAADLAAEFPGREPPSIVLEAARISARLITSLEVSDTLVLSSYVGYRLDGSGATFEQPERLRDGDRIALGFSDSDAILVGAGGSYRAGDTRVSAEVTWDVLVGEDAPSLGKTPLHVALGVRHSLSPSIALDLVADVVPTGRPAQGPDLSLAPIEPRFAILAGLRYAMPLEPAPVDTSDGHVVEEEGEVPDEEPEAPRGRRVEGQVLDPDGAPIRGADVELRAEGRDPRSTLTDEQGSYVFEDAPPGPAEVVIRAEGFEETTVTVGAEHEGPQRVEMTRATPSGELRGLVRSFAGDPIAATIRIEPGPLEITVSADGRFSTPLDVGTYTVTIEARGYRDQTRQVTIRADGVAILNVEMYRRR